MSFLLRSVRHGCCQGNCCVWDWCCILLAQILSTVHTRGRDRHWLEIIHNSSQVSAGLINGCSEGREAVWGAAAMQLCYVVPSQPQTDDMVDVVAVLSRWHLDMLHGWVVVGRSGLAR